MGVDTPARMPYNMWVIKGTPPHMNSTEEYLEKVVIDICAKSFTLYSDEGNTRIIDCETSEQFMSVFLLVRDRLEEEQIKYTGVSVCQD